MVKYLSEDETIAINKEVLQNVKVKKADKFDVLSRLKLSKVLESAKTKEGDVLDKAIVLLKGLAQEHPFASGNRRMAIVAAIKFLELNGLKANFEHNPKTLQGIRENFYTEKEIREWLSGGEMREFKRK